jgi:RES domain-containing protein
MLAGEALARALAKLPTHSFKGTAYRIIPAQYHVSALSGIGSLTRGGRYNPRGKLEALYLAEDPITALQEVEAVRLTSAGLIAAKSSPKTLLSVEYELQVALDLTTVETQTARGTTLEELIAPYLTLEAKHGLAPTQALGLAAAEAGIEVLRVPSAKNRTAANLVIYPRNLKSPSTLRVIDDTGFIDARLP